MSGYYSTTAANNTARSRRVQRAETEGNEFSGIILKLEFQYMFNSTTARQQRTRTYSITETLDTGCWMLDAAAKIKCFLISCLPVALSNHLPLYQQGSYTVVLQCAIFPTKSQQSFFYIVCIVCRPDQPKHHVVVVLTVSRLFLLRILLGLSGKINAKCPKDQISVPPFSPSTFFMAINN
jgi:hypothetical protein